MAYKRRNFKKKSKEESAKMGKIKHKVTVIDGITFHSKMESKYYEYLKVLKSNNEVLDFKLQPEFLLQEKFIIVEGTKYKESHEDFAKIKRKTKAPTISAIKYIADFEVTYPDGSVRIVDTKGIETADFNIKKKMFQSKFPHLPLDIIILNDKKGWIPFSEHKKDIAAAKKAKRINKIQEENTNE